MLAGIALLSTGGPFGTDMYLPSLPEITEELDTTASLTQLTITAFMVGMAVGQLVIGPLSDRVGRNRLLVGATIVALVSSVLCALAPSVGLFIVVRFFQGAAGGAGVTLGRAMIADRVQGAAAAAALSTMMMFTSLAPILAPVVGGAVAGLAGWRAVFWTLAGLALLQVVVALALPETHPKENRATGSILTVYRRMGGLFLIGPYVGHLVAFAVGFGVLFAFISGSSFVMQEQFGLSASTFSLVFAGNAAALVLANMLNVRIVGRVGAPRMQIVGQTLLVIGAVGLLVVALTVHSLPLVAVLTFVATIGTGFNMGNTTAQAMDLAPGRAGAASALLGAAQFLMAGLVAPLAGLGDDGLLTMATIMVVCASVAVVGGVVGRRGAARLALLKQP
ncbi:MAG TPA: multidrug effflux MFS transporter [Candidatus Corynebacterium avicola]|uniref:Multidrug effflux MFS transporter n=1 Tax=Candidatus Corynebacterium avicola TaxID=2838527 RepID=A0A9D1RPN2_9CORY|nr:multidrug effflux MFS transporter [Candidatus Corynebacterium avicola]